MLKRMLIAAWMIGALAAVSASASAEKKAGDLAKAMSGVKVTLQQGLAASHASQGSEDRQRVTRVTRSG